MTPRNNRTLMKNIGTRVDAQKNRLPRYFTGKACCKGHIAERFTSNRVCVQCSSAPIRYARRDQRQRKRSAELQRYRRKLPTPTRPCPELCECCGKPPRKRGIHLDHDHTTGAFRGWLCFNCNTSIGKLGDNIEGVARAMIYLSGVRL